MGMRGAGVSGDGRGRDWWEWEEQGLVGMGGAGLVGMGRAGLVGWEEQG